MEEDTEEPTTWHNQEDLERIRSLEETVSSLEDTLKIYASDNLHGPQPARDSLSLLTLFREKNGK